MGNTHERMANDMGLMAADQENGVCIGILHERGATVYSDGQGENRETCGKGATCDRLDNT